MISVYDHYSRFIGLLDCINEIPYDKDEKVRWGNELDLSVLCEDDYELDRIEYKEKEMFLFFYIITCFFIFFLRRPVAISIINFQLSTVN